MQPNNVIASTTLDRVEIMSGGFVQIRLSKTIEQEGIILAKEYHRCAFAPHQDIDMQVLEINNHLNSMKYPPMKQSDIDQVKRYAAIAWENIFPGGIINE